MGRDGPWKRPPTCYEEDEEANADGYFIFNLLDRDHNAHLDLKEVTHARKILLELAEIHADLHDIIDNATTMLESCADENNDAKVIEEEWHDFLRAIYELVGRNGFRDLLNRWRKLVLFRKAQEDEAAAQVAKARAEKQDRGRHPNKNQGKKKEEAAATKVQALMRGNQARRGTTNQGPRARRGSKSQGPRSVQDPVKINLAKEAGRHLITVNSAGADWGARADFYMDGKEIDFTRAHGDNGRGLQVVVLDPETCKIVSRKVYEAFHPQTKAECARLAEDLAALPTGHFVLAANKGYGVGELTKAGVAALRSVGASFEGLGGQREASYALVGCKGCLASDENSSSEGSTMAEAAVSFDARFRGQSVLKGETPRDLAP